MNFQKIKGRGSFSSHITLFSTFTMKLTTNKITYRKSTKKNKNSDKCSENKLKSKFKLLRQLSSKNKLLTREKIALGNSKKASMKSYYPTPPLTTWHFLQNMPRLSLWKFLTLQKTECNYVSQVHEISRFNVKILFNFMIINANWDGIAAI